MYDNKRRRANAAVVNLKRITVLWDYIIII